MSKMKDSRIQWIGNIPEEWKKIKIKNACKKVFAGGTPSTDIEEYWNGTIPWLPSGACHDKYIETANIFITEKGFKNSSTKLIPANTTLIAMTGATCGNTGYLTFDSCANQSVTAYINDEKKLNSLYLFYALQAAREYILTYQTGGAQAGINVDNCKNFIIPITNIKEQKLIADFLDDKVKKIDNIIADLNNEIEILNQYKESLVIKIVTKGLHNTVKMKDSNIKWIGKIPAHWNVRKIKHSFIDDKFGIKVGPFGSSLTDCVVDSENGNYKIYGQANLIRRNFDYGDNYVNDKDFRRLKNYEVIPGDIVVSMMGTIGKCRVVPGNIKKGIMDSHLIKIRLNTDMMNPKYFEYQYEGKNIYEQLLFYSNGSIMNGLNSSVVKNIYFVYPPIDEQKEIVKYLDDKCEKIDEILNSKMKQKDQMEQYKKSVIYEYVTGKKRVEGAEELYG